MNKNELPRAIMEQLGDMTCINDTVGQSEAKVNCYFNKEKTVYLKKERINQEFTHEIEMLAWLKDRLPVPNIITKCIEGEYEYLLMTKVKGKMACSSEYLKEPEVLVRNLAEGIKMLQGVNIEECVFDCRIEAKLDRALKRINGGKIATEDWERDTQFNSPIEMYNYLKNNKPVEELVFTHGDYCFENIFFDEIGVSGFIDLGRAGIGDRWQDIALCVRSIEHTLDDRKYVDLFFNYLGIRPNYDKINYYILLDELF